MTGLVASNIINNKLQVLATAMTCLPLPLFSLAPSIIPGKSSIYILAPLYLKTPGTHVKVENSFSETRELIPATKLMKVDLPTEGNPINPILASPVFDTSNPSPPPPYDFNALSNNSLFNLANLAFNNAICPSVLFDLTVLLISSSMS